MSLSEEEFDAGRPPSAEETDITDLEASPDATDGGPAVKKARSRQNFSWRQISVLEQVFEVDPLPSPSLRVELANRLGITPRCVQVWFQNRRQKWKTLNRTQSGKVAPLRRNPNAVAQPRSTPHLNADIDGVMLEGLPTAYATPIVPHMSRDPAVILPNHTHIQAPAPAAATLPVAQPNMLEQLQAQMQMQQAQLLAMRELHAQELQESHRENERLQHMVMQQLHGAPQAQAIAARPNLGGLASAVAAPAMAPDALGGYASMASAMHPHQLQPAPPSIVPVGMGGAHHPLNSLSGLGSADLIAAVPHANGFGAPMQVGPTMQLYAQQSAGMVDPASFAPRQVASFGHESMQPLAMTVPHVMAPHPDSASLFSQRLSSTDEAALALARMQSMVAGGAGGSSVGPPSTTAIATSHPHDGGLKRPLTAYVQAAVDAAA